jgi:hypothetical protein
MKNKTIWLALGGIGLVVAGIMIGFLLSGGMLALRPPRVAEFIQPFAYSPMMGRHMMSFWGRPYLFWGLGWLVMALFWLGPIAGIAALIIVLAGRKKPSATAQPNNMSSVPPKA